MANQWVSPHKRTTRVPCMGKEANIIERLTRLLPPPPQHAPPGVLFWFLPPELKVHPLSVQSKQRYMWMNLRQHPSAAAKSPTDSSTSHPSTGEAPPTSISWMNPGLASNHPFSEGAGWWARSNLIACHSATLEVATWRECMLQSGLVSSPDL